MSSIAIEDPDEYQYFQGFLLEEFGIVIGEEKRTAINEKIQPVMDEFSIDSISDLIKQLNETNSAGLKAALVQSITASDTGWFEQRELYQLLAEYILPDLQQKGQDRYRIWLVGCGKGQTPYSISICIDEYKNLHNSGVEVDILATDVSDEIIQTAQRGLFAETDLDGLTKNRLQKYFTEDNETWQIDPAIQTRVQFKACNILDCATEISKSDLIICSKTLMYLSLEMKKTILEDYANVLETSGILIVGTDDSVVPLNQRFEMVQTPSGMFYRKNSD